MFGHFIKEEAEFLIKLFECSHSEIPFRGVRAAAGEFDYQAGELAHPRLRCQARLRSLQIVNINKD